MRNPRLMVIGYARHGKDTVCNMLHDMYRLQFVSSSYFVADKAVRPFLARKGICYETIELCYADRINHRADWYDAICAYNADDAARLGRELFAEYDIYCGLRNIREFNALKAEKAFDVCFWVDRSKYEKSEDRSSNTLSLGEADYIINNNSTLDDLKSEIIITMNRARDDGLIENLPKLNLLHL